RVIHLPDPVLRDVLPIFLAAGDDGIGMIAEVILDPKTTSETKTALMAGYGWRAQATPATLRILRALLKDKSAVVRASALTSLRFQKVPGLTPDYVALLADLELLDVPSHYMFDDPYHVAHALGNQGKEAVPSLIKALEHEAPLARFQAASALFRIGKDAA